MNKTISDAEIEEICQRLRRYAREADDYLGPPECAPAVHPYDAFDIASACRQLMAQRDEARAAVLAEREACAKVAEELETLECWLPTGDVPGEGKDRHATIHGEKIAAAIRSRPTPEKGEG